MSSARIRRFSAHRAIGALLAASVMLSAGCSAISQSSANDPLISTADTLPPTPASGDRDLSADQDGRGSIRIELPESPRLPASSAGTGGSGTGQSTAIGSTPGGGSGGLAAFSIVAQATVPSLAARTAPDGSSGLVADFTNPTASGAPLVFLAIEGGATSAEWIEVLLPVQPNGTTGWVRRDEVELSNNPYRVEIDRAGHSLSVYYLNDLWLDTTVAIGTGDTPTPVGDFYLLELLRPLDADGPYGPYAFGLSGFSEVLSSFGGADSAIIGIHGTNDPAALGSDVSFGCVRMENRLIEQLATTLPLGTPVQIT